MYKASYLRLVYYFVCIAYEGFLKRIIRLEKRFGFSSVTIDTKRQKIEALSIEWASKYGHLEVVKLLLEAGANVHTLDDLAISLASEEGHLEVVKLLLDAGADVHSK